MNVAVSLFGKEVSPRLGCSNALLIASIHDGRLQDEKFEDCSWIPPRDLPDFLASREVSTVICGGVHRRLQEDIERRGIRVIWGVIGPAAEALSAFIRGTLRSDQFVCPGPGRVRARHRGAQRGAAKTRGSDAGPGRSRGGRNGSAW